MPDDDDSFFSSSSSFPSFRATKRDSLAAELERDPHLSTAKRAHRTHTFTSTLAHASLERQLAAAHSARTDLERQLRERDATIERLEHDRRWLAERERAQCNEKEREREEHASVQTKTTADTRALRTALSALKETYTDLEEAHALLARTSAHTTANQQAQLDTLEHRASLLAGELAQARELLDERGEALRSLRAHLEEGYVSRAEEEEGGEDPDVRDGGGRGSALGGRVGATQQQRAEDMALVQSELHRQAAYLRELERANVRLAAEAERLRERAAGAAVLREEKRALEGKVGVMEGLRERVVLLEAELERERARTPPQSTPTSTPSASAPPIPTTHALAALRLTHAQLLASHGTTLAALRTLEARLPDLAAAESRVSELERENGALEDRAARAEEGRARAEGEGRGLRRILASYAAEAAASRADHDENDQGMGPDVHAEHVAHLETVLGEYKAANEKLSVELDALGGDAGALVSAGGEEGERKGPPGQGRTRERLVEEAERARVRVVEVEEQLKQTNLTISSHLTQIDGLEQELFELKGEIAGGRHVPPGVRVLEMRENPAREWSDLREAVVKRLRGENEALLRRLRDVEAGRTIPETGTTEGGARSGGGAEGSGGDLVPRESWELLNREKQALEEVVRQKEKRLLRLKQVYNAKGAEFRDAIASILGVKIMFVPNGQVRVTSVFDLCASFVFQPASTQGQSQGQSQGQQGAGQMQLVAQGDGGPQDLPDLMRFWVEKEGCLPGFMASVTLECYENAKRAGRDV